MQPNRDNDIRTAGPVMDIQRPSPPPPMPSSEDNIIRPNANSLGRPATMEYTRPRPVDATDPNSPTTSFAPPTEASMAPAPVKKAKKSKAPLIIVIVLLLLAGGGAAGYYFLVMNKADTPVATQATPVVEQTTTTTVEATPEGVDATVEKIDKSLNSVDDTKDFTPNDVSDDRLGL